MRNKGISKEKVREWHLCSLKYLERINERTMSELTGENFYSLGHRGRNHQFVLLKDGDVIARGIKAITIQIDMLRNFYGV